MNESSERLALFSSAPIPRAVFALAVPTVITQLINIVYNFADAWYVGRTNNPHMVAALSVSLPVYILLAALANLFGIGGSSAISRALGRQDLRHARRVFVFCIYGGLAAAVLYLLIILFLRPQIIPMIGGSADSYAYIHEYMYWTMVLGAIPTLGNMLCGHLVRSIGAAREAGLGMSMGGVLNILLDPLFMFVILPPGQEVRGAAIATFLSNTAALLYFVIYLWRHRDHPVLALSPRELSPDRKLASEVFMIGIPAALQTTLAMVSNICANVLVAEYGSTAVAGMGIAKKVNMISFNTSMGLTQGVLPLIGYNYGARNRKRLKETISFTALVALIFTISCTLLFRTFSVQLVSFFIHEKASVDFGAAFLRVIALAAPLCAFSYLANTIFQASGKRLSSLLLSILRKGLVDIPAMVLFKRQMGLYGVVWATPFAEIVSIVVAAVLLIRFVRQEILRGQEETDAGSPR